jgi:hypothetical protein
MHICSICNIAKPTSSFYVRAYRGSSTTRYGCISCEKIQKTQWWNSKSVAYKLISYAKNRRGEEVSITEEDITVPERCPILGRKFEEKGEYAPSIDRSDPTKGYVKGNVRVVSVRGNRLKNNGTHREFKYLVEYMKTLEDELYPDQDLSLE